MSGTSHTEQLDFAGFEDRVLFTHNVPDCTALRKNTATQDTPASASSSRPKCPSRNCSG